jgi:aryl-alcohol dehydrogenase-like predicted oxidoreductase
VLGGASFSKLPPVEVFRILEYAQELGICEIDTSPLYGSSEKTIGQYLKMNYAFKISTKVGRPSTLPYSPSLINSQIEQSLESLGCDQLENVFIHSLPAKISLDEYNLSALLRTKQLSLTRNIGYSGDNMDLKLTAGIFDSYMCTFNYLDRSNANFISNYSGHSNLYLKRVLANGIWNTARLDRLRMLFRIYSQGIESVDTQTYLFRLLKMFNLRDLSKSGLELFINFSLANASGARLVFGVSSVMHLKEIAEVLNSNFEIYGESWARDIYNSNSAKYGWLAII